VQIKVESKKKVKKRLKMLENAKKDKDQSVLTKKEKGYKCAVLIGLLLSNFQCLILVFGSFWSLFGCDVWKR
jgi:hypothetical protein